MKNVCRSILTSLIVVLALSSCAPAKNVVDTSATPEKTKSAAAQASKTPVSTKVSAIEVEPQQLSGVEITFLHPWTGETSRVIDEMVDEFNQTNEWGIQVIVKTSDSVGQFAQAFSEGINKGDPADVLAAPSSFLLTSDLAENNILDLNSYVQSSTYGLSPDEINDFLPAFWEEDINAGKRYGVPAQRTAALIFYNSTWANELGYANPPQTTDGFRQQMCAANSSMKLDYDRSNDSLGGWIINTDASSLTSWLHSFEAISSTEPVEKYNTADAALAFKFLYQLQKDSCAWSSNNPEPYAYFVNRQTLAYSGVMQDIVKQTNAFSHSENADDWTVLAYPTDGEAILLSEGISYGIVKSDDDQQLAAWLFVRWMLKPEQQASLLETSGTLPLGSNVLSHLTEFRAAYPKWNEVISLLPIINPDSPQENLDIKNMVLEDAATYMFRTEFTQDKIPSLLQQVDNTIKELEKREQ